MSAPEEDGEEDSHGGSWRGRHQPWGKMERKTSAMEEDISDDGRWRGRPAMMEDGEEDISHKGRWRERHQPQRKMERKTSASKEDGE